MRWSSRYRLAKMLGVSQMTVAKIAKAGQVRTRRLPGMTYLQYSVDDFERIMAESVRDPASAESPSEASQLAEAVTS